MAGNTIDAKLRIAADVADAIAKLKALRAELKATNKTAADAGGATSAGSGGKSAGEQATADATQVVSQVKRRTQAEREAAAETKRLAREEADAKKTAARETKKLADEEERRQKQAANAAQRRKREADDAEARSKRAQSYKGAALAPQLNDVFVGLTTGQSPLQIALQQGPQITQIYGGVTNTFRALLTVLTPLRLVLGGVAAGFAAVALGAAAGDRESSQLRKTLALTGNAAGTSLGQINSLALDISDATRRSGGALVALAISRLCTCTARPCSAGGTGCQAGKSIMSTAPGATSCGVPLAPAPVSRPGPEVTTEPPRWFASSWRQKSITAQKRPASASASKARPPMPEL